MPDGRLMPDDAPAPGAGKLTSRNYAITNELGTLGAAVAEGPRPLRPAAENTPAGSASLMGLRPANSENTWCGWVRGVCVCVCGGGGGGGIVYGAG